MRVLCVEPPFAGHLDLPGLRVVTVIGGRDLLSRALHRAAPDIRVPCGHLGYWTCPETRAAVAGALRGWAP